MISITKDMDGNIASIEIYHRIKGEWYHFMHTDLNTNNPKMYTNGELEECFIEQS